MKQPRATFGVLDCFANEAVRRTPGVDLALAEHLDGQVAELEAYLLDSLGVVARTARLPARSPIDFGDEPDTQAAPLPPPQLA